MNGNRSRMDRLHNTVGLACILPITVLFSAFVSLLCPLERSDAHPPGHRQLVSPGRGPGTGKLHYFCRNKCCTKFLQFCKTSSLDSHGSAFILPPGSRRDKLEKCKEIGTGNNCNFMKMCIKLINSKWEQKPNCRYCWGSVTANLLIR